MMESRVTVSTLPLLISAKTNVVLYAVLSDFVHQVPQQAKSVAMRSLSSRATRMTMAWSSSTIRWRVSTLERIFRTLQLALNARIEHLRGLGSDMLTR